MITDNGGSEYGYSGMSVDIDADLVCAIAKNDVYIFRKDGGQQWDQIQHLNLGNVYSCSVVDNTIAMQGYHKICAYQFNEELGEYISLQVKGILVAQRGAYDTFRSVRHTKKLIFPAGIVTAPVPYRLLIADPNFQPLLLCHQNWSQICPNFALTPPLILVSPLQRAHLCNPYTLVIA